MRPQKTILLFMALCAFSWSACKNNHREVEFDLPDETSFTISSSAGVNLPYNFPTPPLTTNAGKQFSENNTDVKLLEEVKLKALKLTISSPSGQNFDFLKALNLYISAPGLPEVQVATAQNISTGIGNILDFGGTPFAVTLIQDVYLEDYLKASSFSIRAQVTTDQVLLHDIQVRLDFTAHVRARVFSLY